MATNPDDDFIRKYEAYENESVDDFILRNSSSRQELESTVAFLTGHRQQLRDMHLEELHAERKFLEERLKEIEFETQNEEIACLKDILKWQKHLEDDQPRD